MGGPNSAETDGPGGPLSAGDQIFRDRKSVPPPDVNFGPLTLVMHGNAVRV